LHFFCHLCTLRGEAGGDYYGCQKGKGNEEWERVIERVSMIKVDDMHVWKSHNETPGTPQSEFF
jgi:hypothetical protein